jgi:hypothetical protein
MTHLGHIPVSDLPMEGYADITVRVVLTYQTRGPLRATVEDASGETVVAVGWKCLTSDAESLVEHGAILRMRIECSVTRKGTTVYRNRDLFRVRELREGESLDTEAIVGNETEIFCPYGCYCDCSTWTEHASRWGGWKALTWDKRQEGADKARDDYTLWTMTAASESDPAHGAAGGSPETVRAMT